MIRRPPRSTLDRSSAASDVYKRQILWMMERTFFGPRREIFDNLTDASLVEAAPLALMVVTIIGIGVWPSLLTDVFESGLNPMVDALNGVIDP